MHELFESIMQRKGFTPKAKAIGYEALRATASTLDLSPPQKVEVKGLDGARAAVDQQHAKIGQLKTNLVQALQWERDVEEELDNLKTADERRLLMKELGKETDKVGAFLKECYAESNPIFRTAIAVTLIRFFLQKTFRSLEDYHRAAYQLRARGLMEHAQNGDSEAMLIGYENLKCINCATMERSEDDEIRRMAATFTQKMQDEWNRRSKELQGRATITLDQLLDGTPGKCYLAVDKEEVRRREDGKEKVSYRSGGQLLIESLEDKVTLVDGVGGATFTRWRDFVLEKKNMNLTLREVNARRAPGHAETFPKVVKAIRKDTGLSEERAEEYLGKLQAFWHYIRRAVKTLKQGQEGPASKKD